MAASTVASPTRSVAEGPRWDGRGLAVVAFAHGASDFYSGILPLIIFYVVTHSGLSPVFQGVIGFVWYFTSSIVQPLFGAYSDKHGRWWFLPVSVAFTAIGVSLAGLATSPWMLSILVVLGGLGSAVMHPEAGRYAAMMSGTRKAGGISIFQIGGSIGYGIGPAVAAVALTRHGGGGTLWLLIPGALAVTAIYFGMRHVAPRAERSYAPASAAASGRVDRVGIGLMVASTSLRHLVGAAFVTFLPNLLVGRGMSLVEAGQIVTLFLLLGTIGMFAGGALADRFGALFISVASLVAAVPFLLLFFVLGGPLAIAALVFGNVLLAVQNAPGVALVQAMLPRNLGMALGLMNGVAFGIGSALVAGVGLVVAGAGASAALYGVSWMPLVSALAYLAVGRRLPENEMLRRKTA